MPTDDYWHSQSIDRSFCCGLVFGSIMLATGGDPPRPEGPWKAQAIALVSVTVPYTLCFAICECSQWRATIGKRAFGLIAVRIVF